MKKRVVITGMGVVAPNAIGLNSFSDAIRNGVSGIAFDPELEALQFSCRISGRPPITQELIDSVLTNLEQRQFNASGILYGLISGLEAWQDAGLPVNETTDYDSGTLFGCGTSGVEKFRESIYKIDAGRTRALGSTAVSQTMGSGISAFLAGKLGLGNWVSSNSSACTTGVESLLLAYERIASGGAVRMLAGSTSDSGPYLWGGFDAMRVCTFKHNDDPTTGSRPMSASSSGFVPAAGAGAMVLEELESALKRGAKIYAEVIGGHLNSGGQRHPGSMTAPNPEGVQRCITSALKNANVNATDIDAINGHLTATSKDALEIQNWQTALSLEKDKFPPVNSLKSMVGHCISAAGSIESVASVLQISEGFIFGNVNCEDLHPDIKAMIGRKNVPESTITRPVGTVIKASFGFGDVNGCIIFKAFKP